MDDPICIIGMACRLPGDIASPSDLWDFLVGKRSAQGSVPKSRFNIRGFHDRDGSRAGVMDSAGGYFLSEDVRQFDNGFFGINNLEATYMDPQQRKLLEVVFECFEHAGVTLDSVSGSNTGVYVGNFTLDYLAMQTCDPDSIRPYTATGCGTTILANRVSHCFNLQGPRQVFPPPMRSFILIGAVSPLTQHTTLSFTLDTACSSSIYCLHTAVTAIQAGDCDTAIVAGVNLIIGPNQSIATSKAGVLSPTSTCHTFDVSADGYGRAEGVNAVYLKRLSRARNDGDKIWAVVRGTAVNANGKTPGITQPSAGLQEAVIRKAYYNANLTFKDTQYVECHGTGTPVGDPIEVEALGRCFNRAGDAPLLIGSSKPNLGHSEAASGLTGLIKVVLALENGTIPPTYGVKVLNPKLLLASRNMRVVTEVEKWPPGTPRRASLNAFGYGGANSHVILEALDSYTECDGVCMGPRVITNNDSDIAQGTNRTTQATGLDQIAGPITNGHQHEPKMNELLVLPVSAASTKSLELRIKHVHSMIKTCDVDTLRSLAYTLGERRSHLGARHALLVRAGTKEPIRHVSSQESASYSEQLPLGFVFTGQGAQYAYMARELLQNNDQFRATITNLDHKLQALPPDYAPDWTLEQTILDPRETGQINSVARSQPVCAAIQIALVDLLRTWGVKPSAGVVGHSSGEIAAAYAAGLLTATQALVVAYFRGYVCGQLPSEGAMLAAAVSVEAAERLIHELSLGAEICVACVNSPQSVTFSGSAHAVDVLMAEIQGSQKRFARKIQTGGRAYHSNMMKDVGPLYESLLRPYFGGTDGNLRPVENGEKSTTARFKMFSSVGFRVDDLKQLGDNTDWPNYWRQNLEQPVQFCSATERLVTHSEKVHLVEIGPHSALKGPIAQIRSEMGLKARDLPYTCTIVRGSDSEECVKSLAATLHLYGYALSWRIVNFPSASRSDVWPRHFPHLRPYPWDYSSELLWHEPRASADLRTRAYPRHELLGSQQMASNGIDWRWRNVLRLEEVPWLRDHKLETQIVFPATGYLAMAVEALKQIRGSTSSLPVTSGTSIEFRNTSVHAALVVPDNQKGGRGVVELHTTMSARRLSTSTMSSVWYDFLVSSWIDGTTTQHCAGSMCLHSEVDDPGNSGVNLINVNNTDGFEYRPSLTRWYEQFRHNGLAFGPSFQSVTSLKTDGDRQRREAVATTRLTMSSSASGNNTGESQSSTYLLHPIVMDACLQATIMSTTAGDVNELQALLPVFIERCQIRLPASHQSHEPGEIHARASRTGVSTNRMDCTLRNSQDIPIITFNRVRMTQYTAKVIDNVKDSRQPCLRVIWKPDVVQLNTGHNEHFQNYVSDFVKSHRDAGAQLADDKSVAVTGALLDLLGHKNPRMSVLELAADCHCKSRLLLELLNDGTGFKRYGSWHRGSLNDQGKLVQDRDSGGLFDVVLLTERKACHDYWEQAPETISSLLGHQGAMITLKTTSALKALRRANFEVLEANRNIVFGLRRLKQVDLVPKVKRKSPVCNGVIIVTQEEPASPSVTAFVNVLVAHLREQFDQIDVKPVTISEVNTVQTWRGVLCIALLELEDSFLLKMSQREMDDLRHMTNHVTTLLWVTGADMLTEDPNPRLTLSSGLSRAIMLEQPSLNFMVLDIGSVDNMTARSDALSTCENITKLIETASSDSKMNDKEYIQRHRLLHISRFVPDFQLNSLFRRRLDLGSRGDGSGAPAQRTSLASARPCQLAIGRPGVTETIHFRQVREPEAPLPADFVDILVRAVSLNAKDVYALNGKVETRDATIALEFSGTVLKAGTEVSHVREGDNVVVLAPCHFSTTERAPAWAVHKMIPSEAHDVMSTLPVVFATALYALRDRGRLEAGKSVLIHSGAGAFGLAAIAIAKHMGAIVYTTAGSAERRSFVANHMGLPEDHVFSSRDVSFHEGVYKATGGRGVDVVINSLVGDLMHASWSLVAPFGCFVEIGKKELVDAGRLNMDVFLRNATFTAFDLSDLFSHNNKSHRDSLCSLVSEVLELYRSGEIAPVPTTTFPVSEIVKAYRYFSSKERVGKVVISLDDDDASIPVSPSKYLAVFDPEKVYLLVGCLGGLGRSLSRWMLTRGARNLVFLARSGCDKPSARDQVMRLEKAGAKVTVVRGDVSVFSHVSEAVNACETTGKPIGGVVQAAMGLHESLFSNMTSEAWHTSIEPKCAGTLNLHRAIEGHDDQVDFFLLMSSVSGSVGTATESNYCAANGFLDSFARWRRTQGKPAVSVGLGMISEVGYLHENPDIESLLLRRGVQPLTEAEFLQVIDLAIAGDKVPEQAQHQQETWSGHVLTGLEPFGIRQLMERGFDVSHGAMEDPRAAVLSAALKAERWGGTGDGAHTTASTGRKAAAAWFKSVPIKASDSLAPVADATSLRLAVLQLVRKRFSNLILIPVEEIIDEKPLATVGVDSMIASEFRSWFWTTFNVDVPFLDLLSPDKSLRSLAKFVEQELTSSVNDSKEGRD